MNSATGSVAKFLLIAIIGAVLGMLSYSILHLINLFFLGWDPSFLFFLGHVSPLMALIFGKLVYNFFHSNTKDLQLSSVFMKRDKVKDLSPYVKKGYYFIQGGAFFAFFGLLPILMTFITVFEEYELSTYGVRQTVVVKEVGEHKQKATLIFDVIIEKSDQSTLSIDLSEYDYTKPSVGDTLDILLSSRNTSYFKILN